MVPASRNSRSFSRCVRIEGGTLAGISSEGGRAEGGSAWVGSVGGGVGTGVAQPVRRDMNMQAKLLRFMESEFVTAGGRHRCLRLLDGHLPEAHHPAAISW